MRFSPARIFLVIMVLLNVLAFVQVSRHGLPPVLVDSLGQGLTCAIWLAANLLCFILYKRMRA